MPVLTIEAVAQICHEANRAYCSALGDLSQPSWADAPEWQTSSAIQGVAFHRDNPQAGPQASHDHWLKTKYAAGWQYGPVKNPETKEHPCCVPFDALPQEQQAKDVLFRNTVHALLPLMRVPIARIEVQ